MIGVLITSRIWTQAHTHFHMKAEVRVMLLQAKDSKDCQQTARARREATVSLRRNPLC